MVALSEAYFQVYELRPDAAAGVPVGAAAAVKAELGGMEAGTGAGVEAGAKAEPEAMEAEGEAA